MKLKHLYIVFPLLCVLSLVASPALNREKVITPRHTSSYNSFALLELFTSEGCSSCPPADRLLAQLGHHNESVIPLSFHVDYWNRLGWTDKFSSSEYSERQKKYASQFGLESIYTPQLVVNGKYELVGSNRNKAESVIAKALSENASVKLSINNFKSGNEKISFNVSLEGNTGGLKINAALIERNVVTNVKAGENRGATLTSVNVVRGYVSKDAKNDLSFEMIIPGKIGEWEIIVYSQQKNDLAITGATVFQPEH
ncbi:MAG TPA: DUF1223 domain-containing protein [Chitinophagaceae bacterium]|nr:DUF1223 domain-containing protein [Chitinophagaceae bacterium]